MLIYGAIGVSVLESLFLVSIAEFASAHPSAGGIPYDSRILAGPDWGRFAVCCPRMKPSKCLEP